jgi:isoaspartyl peptidase/L-asparaginase-like protein (Ntn-hydrolase superfamily)
VTYAILTHGGAGSSEAYSDGCVVAAERAQQVLERGGDALEAAVAATVVLEDDPRFNAGTGSTLRLDGQTTQMDASVVTSDARFGAVGCIEAVKNPILVAVRVMETPHVFLVGEGATAFARRLGFPEYNPLTPGARQKFESRQSALHAEGDDAISPSATQWTRESIARYWNFEGEPPQAPPAEAPGGGCETVGAVVRDSQGRFAATASTGGTLFMLRGRVGDSPLLGAGVYAGPEGAVAATGLGEEIIRRLVAKTVYDALANGMPALQAAQRVLVSVPRSVAVGVLVVGRTTHAVASTRPMPSALLVG